MKEEAKEGCPLIPLTNFKTRLLAGTQIGENVYRRICKEAEDVASGVIPGFSTPDKSRKRKYQKKILCVGEMKSIRAIIPT
ncbi:hypothetical protein BDFB_012630 [Asbolus verrucosus]|uniref:Uncharacterized protein n=1 Tax=Asbolus verrucosus TaxID=1661398 RepID=A0A482W317_ASBVE|nr:hypothetical protein BDFB_012630 [Asbolus verrucosus]